MRAVVRHEAYCHVRTYACIVRKLTDQQHEKTRSHKKERKKQHDYLNLEQATPARKRERKKKKRGKPSYASPLHPHQTQVYADPPKYVKNCT